MNNINVLNEIHKGAKMGMDSIDIIIDKIDDNDFRETLTSQYDEYKSIYTKTEFLLKDKNAQLEKTNAMEKAMLWTGIQLNTLTDKSNSQISDLLIQGTNMGIVKGIQILNQNPNMDENIKNTVNEFVSLQERNLDDLKRFL